MDQAHAVLPPEELIRYNRQILYKEWGDEGQKKMKRATVFIAGAGGLGSPVAVYLAVAGIGRLRICDNGSVELSNLNRQILYGDYDIDRLKVSAAKNQVNRLNPQVTVDCFSETMVRKNVGDLIGDADIIVDCLDNFETRLILNEYAVAHGLPFVHAGIEGFAGQLTFIHSPATPCLRCITPEVPAKKLFSVVGTTPGVVGCLEANEVIKYLTGIGSNSRNILLIWDGLKNELHRVEIAKDPECPVCGKKTDK